MIIRVLILENHFLGLFGFNHKMLTCFHFEFSYQSFVHKTMKTISIQNLKNRKQSTKVAVLELKLKIGNTFFGTK